MGTFRQLLLTTSSRRLGVVLMGLPCYGGIMSYPTATFGVSPSRKQTLRSKLRSIEPGSK